jgi:hypothetical protein
MASLVKNISHFPREKCKHKVIVMSIIVQQGHKIANEPLIIVGGIAKPVAARLPRTPPNSPELGEFGGVRTTRDRREHRVAIKEGQFG